MNWGDWTPQENVVLSIREVLQEALIPDNEIQKNVQHKLNIFQSIGDFTYYLLYIISNPNYSEEIRSLSGILLKNNINSAHASKMSQDELIRVRQQCLRLLQDPCKDIRSSISNVLVMLAKDNLAAWPELVPLLIDSFDVCNEFSEISLNTLTKICEEIIRNCKSEEEIYTVTTKVFPKLNDMLGLNKCSLHLEIIKLVNQFLQEYFMIIKQSLDLSSFVINVMKYAESEDVEVQKQISLTFVLYLEHREDSLLPHIHDVIIYLLAKTQHKDSDVALQACEFWITATRLTNCKELLTPYVDKLLPILLKNMKYSEYELTALKDCLGNDAHEKDQAKDIYRKCPWHLIAFLSRVVIEKTRSRCKKQPLDCGFSPSDNAYQPLKLMQTVIEVINEVCFSYKSSLNVQNMAVSNPLPPPEAIYNVVSVSAMKNTRRKMEDKYIVIQDLNTIFTKQDATPSHYYAVFDGHDGEHAAAYSANHLHQYLAESTNFTTDLEQAIRDAFCKTDSMFLNKCETEKIAGGTTAVCALLLPKEKTLYIAWAGDSQAALVTQGNVLQCVNPHKPNRTDERLRIENDGGCVMYWGVWRVNGQLGVSRAIGDAEYKPYVTAVPEIVEIHLEGDEDFFVLGSDGLWDHVSETKIATVIYDLVHANPDKANLVSQELVQLAKKNGSTDNISVIVVFLKDPHQIAAGPRWTSRKVTMDTLDNANNPFALPNKTNSENLTPHTDDGLLLNITDGLLKKNDDDLPNNDLIKMLEKSNCERLTPEFDKDDNLGPETDIDNIEDGSISPNIDVMKRQSEAINNNESFNPFNDIEKSLEINLNLKEGTFEGLISTPTEESCPLPPNSVHNVSQLIDAGAVSDSEEDEEWNYVRGEEANKENVHPLQLNSEVAEEEETEDNMSQLNPNAAEFVPVSPTRAVASPLGRIMNEDSVLSSSPKKPPPTDDLDLDVPSPVDFEKDISQKPHEIDEALSNGHQNDEVDDINENGASNKFDEFHFGPNATPFTPNKLLDQSEASSVRAVYGDESELNTTFNESAFCQDSEEFVQKNDPMSMSFHQDRVDDDPFDLNKVHVLPEDVDEFINKVDDSTNSLINDTISDLEEHFPLGKSDEPQETPDVLTTDLDIKDDNNEMHIQENEITSVVEEKIESPIEVERVLSPLTPGFDEKQMCSKSEEKEVSSSLEEKEQESLIEENIPLDDKEVQLEHVSSPQAINDNLEPLKLSTYCDNLESPLQSEPVTSEPSPNNDEFVTFENKKSDKETAKEIADFFLDDKCPIPDTTSDGIVNNAQITNEEPTAYQLDSNKISSNPFGDFDIPRPTELVNEVQKEQIQVDHLIDTVNEDEDVISPSSSDRSQLLLPLDEPNPENIDIHSQPTPESDQPLMTNMDILCPFNNSVKSVPADSESIATVEVNSILERAVVPDVESPLSPNVSQFLPQEIIEIHDSPVTTGNILPDMERTPESSALSSSNFADLTSTPAVGRTSSISPLVSQVKENIPKSPVEEKNVKEVAVPKEADRKMAKIKAAPPNTKKNPTPKSLGSAKPTPTPSPRGVASKTSTRPSLTSPRVNSSSKTDTAASKVASKPLSSTAPKSGSTTSKASLSARPKTLTSTKTTETKNLTNGDTKPTAKTTGAIKKTEATSARSTTSSSSSRPLSSTASRAPLASARSVTSTTAPKPRPNTLKPAPSRTVTAAKTTTVTRTTTTAPKVPAVPKTTSLSTNKDVKAPISKLSPRPKPAVEKQIKETANKLTALKSTKTQSTTQVVSKTSITRKTEEKVSSTTSRTATSRPPIKRPTTEASKTSTTKVGKPKQNGIASAVTETIIVNTGNELNGLNSNGDQQFLKDNSPMDNKLILDETAAN